MRMMAAVALALSVAAGAACGGNGTGGTDDSGGGENTSGPSAACKEGCYRGHGVSFNYPPKWRKTQDVGAPISDLWYLTLVLKTPSDYVEVYGQGQSELGFPPANLAAGKALLQNQREAVGAYRAARFNEAHDRRSTCPAVPS
jgi:hypothetical protein